METAKTLHQMFGFDGRTYTDCAEMLLKERPDAVSICTPHNLHYEHTMLALSHGVHVLCEKPMVWDRTLSHDELIRQAHEMVNMAKEKKLLLAVNTQYAVVGERLRELYERVRGAWDEPSTFEMHMESKPVGRDEAGADLWMDLSAHPISVLFRLFPSHELDDETIETLSFGSFIKVCFNLKPSEPENARSKVECVIALGRAQTGVRRSIKINDFEVSISGRDDEHGIYRACLSSNGFEVVCEDFMHTSIRKFVEAILGFGEPLCSADEGLKNLSWQLRFLRRMEA
jgi:predicted dehydrogenase